MDTTVVRQVYEATQGLFGLSTRAKSRVIVLLVLIGILSVRLVLVASARMRAPQIALVEQQIISRDDLIAESCLSAVTQAHSPAAELAIDRDRALSSVRTVTRVADAVLASVVLADGADVVVTEAVLLSAQFESGERLVWGRLWVATDGETHKGAVVYVDDTLGLPLLLYTDIEVTSLSVSGGCVEPVPLWATPQADGFFLLVLTAGFVFIGGGLLADYRKRVKHFLSHT